ncbi:MAG: hypothetical protein GF388_09615 [Candidatus Aegiribacteria sp.]|nr:hypothetical protein [Candidatus Aegiribacteria sp.]
MRYTAQTKINNSRIKRLMIHECQGGVYLFEYVMLNDGPSAGYTWFENLQTAFANCKQEYGVENEDWETIPDPFEHCQQDWIEPVRIVGRSTGNPRWGRYEKLVDGEWTELNPDIE